MIKSLQWELNDLMHGLGTKPMLPYQLLLGRWYSGASKVVGLTAFVSAETPGCAPGMGEGIRKGPQQQRLRF